MTRSSTCRVHGSASATNASSALYAPITMRRSPASYLGRACNVPRWRSEVEHSGQTPLRVQHVYRRVMLKAAPLGFGDDDDAERCKQRREIPRIFHPRESPRVTASAIVASVFPQTRRRVE